MLIVGENLLGLIKSDNVIEESCYDTTCVNLSLGDTVIYLKPTDKHTMLVYGDDLPSDIIEKKQLNEEGLILKPHESVLACSYENVNIPLGFFGLLQTKGSLARLFVSLHYADGQIDPGFKGCVTFEIMNGSDFSVQIKKRQKIGNLYILKTSTNNVNAYSGKYSNSKIPTVCTNS